MPALRRFAQEGFEPLRTKYIASGKVSHEFRSFAIHAHGRAADDAGPLRARRRRSSALAEQIYANFDAMNAPFADQARLAQMQAAMDNGP